MCKRLLIVTNCDPKHIKESEQDLKKIYLNKGSGPALNFAHRGTKPHEIAKFVKEKKPGVLLFDENMPHADIQAILNAVAKKISNMPRMIHINPNKHFERVDNVSNHTEVLIELAA